MQTEVRIKREKTFLTVLLVIFAVLTFICAGRHEMWFDEAEAWGIAKGNSLGELVLVLRSEGHPFLWYLLLKCLIFVGLPCTVMPYVSWFFILMAAFLVVYKAPFKAYTKACLLCSSGFIYYNSIISRVYCLIPLTLVFIALLYPKRKNYPVLYGFLIALLTNTHICIWGVVAVLGLNMLIELIRDFKSNSFKQNFKAVLGLMVAGLGVILFLVVMVGSLVTNQEVSAESKSFSILTESVFTALCDVAVHGMSFVGAPALFDVLFSIIFISVLMLILYCLRHYTVAFCTLLTFTLGYIFVCGVVWFTIPNRAALFFFVIVFSFWLAIESEPAKKPVDFGWLLEHMTLRVTVFAISLLQKIEDNARKVAEVALSVILILSAPVGFYYLFSDYTREFSVERGAAEYIAEHYNSDETLVISLYDSYPQVCCYIPEFSFYALATDGFYTYHDHTLNKKDMNDFLDNLSKEALEAQLQKSLGDKLLLFLNVVNTSGDDEILTDFSNIFEKTGDVVYQSQGALPFVCKGDALILVETDIPQLLSYLTAE